MVHKLAEEAIRLSTEQRFPIFLLAGTLLRKWVLAGQEQGAQETAQKQHGGTTERPPKKQMNQPYFLALLAETHEKRGQPQEGLAVLAEALDIVDNTGEHGYEADLYRLKGELLLVQEGRKQKVKGKRQRSKTETEAEACFQRALEVARYQEAKSWELRAAVSLSRLWKKRGKQKEARQLLDEIYQWFTEGFDTADLKEAQVLLEALA